MPGKGLGASSVLKAATLHLVHGYNSFTRLGPQLHYPTSEGTVVFSLVKADTPCLSYDTTWTVCLFTDPMIVLGEGLVLQA